MSAIWFQFIMLWAFQGFKNCNYLKSFFKYKKWLIKKIFWETFKNSLCIYDMKLEIENN
jgi:hypothetical protein